MKPCPPRAIVTMLAALLLLGACASTPPTLFYTLEPLISSVSSSSGSAISVGPVTVPEAVDRPQMVLRTGTNQVTLAEQRRWAESLRSAIARVVSANLAASGTTTTAATTVAIDIVRFDSQLGVAIDLAANWRIRSGSDAARSGSMAWHEPVFGNDYADLAAGHSRALAQLSRQIAATIATKQ